VKRPIILGKAAARDTASRAFRVRAVQLTGEC
jgi:hypothetical protein